MVKRISLEKNVAAATTHRLLEDLVFLDPYRKMLKGG